MHVGGDEQSRAGEFADRTEARAAGQGRPDSGFDTLFQAHGAANNVDWRLLRAIAEVESHLNPRAINRRDPSFGLMQVHCVADTSGRCTNRFDVEGWAGMTRERLMDPEINVHIGAQVLAWNIRAFGFERGIAVYNRWDARLTPRGRPFPNQFYVDKVLGRYRALSERMPPAGGVANNTRSASRMPQVTPPSGDLAGLPTRRAK